MLGIARSAPQRGVLRFIGAALTAIAMAPALASGPPPPTITLNFVPAGILSGGTSQLVVSFFSGPASRAAITIPSTALTAPLTLIPGSGVTNCPAGGIFSYAGNSFSYTSPIASNLPPASSCAIAIGVTASSPINIVISQPQITVTDSINCPAACIFESNRSATGAQLSVTGGTPPTITSPPPPSGTVNQPYTHQITVTGTAPITVTVNGLPPGLTFNPVTNQITGTPTTVGSFPGSIVASNGFLPNATQNYTIVINGVPPAITSPPPPSGTVGVAYSHQVTVTGTPPIGVVANGLPPGLTFNASTLQVTGTPTTFGSFPGSFVASNGIKPDATQNFTIVINPPPLVITTTSPLPSGSLSSFYSQTFNATGGAPGYTWSQGSLPLPPGLTLTSAGVLSGKPTQAGSFTFDVVVTDTLKTSTTKTFTLVIDGIPPTITSLPPGPGTVGVPYTQTITTTGTPPVIVNVSGLPPGLSFNSSTGQITGTPTTPGNYPGTILAFNGVAPNATQPFDIVISAPPPPTITIPGGGSTLPGGTAGQPVTPTTFTGSGGVPPYTFSACMRPLPPGLTLSPSGVLSGTPTQAGSFVFDVCITDGAGTTTSQPFTLVIATNTASVSISIAPNPDVVSIPVVVTAQVTGGSVTPTGIVRAWAAGTGQKCPAPFAGGKPTDPVAPVKTAPLDAAGRALVAFPNLAIDDYLVCVQYGGDSLYGSANAPVTGVSVIKGVLLGPPKVVLAVPSRVAPSSVINARIAVAGDPALLPQGTIDIVVNGNLAARGEVVNGSAALAMYAPASGVLALVANYSGDAIYPAASSDGATVVVDNSLLAAPGDIAVPALSYTALALLALGVLCAGVLRFRRR